jgi:hypothetical protein
VEVTGGQLLLNEMDTIYTAKVPVDELQKSGEQRVALALVPASLRLAPGQENSILITYTVRPRQLVTSPYFPLKALVLDRDVYWPAPSRTVCQKPAKGTKCHLKMIPE